MKLETSSVNRHVIRVTLSRRNIEALLAKLNGVPEDSALTISKDTEAGRIIVVAEENEVHYGDGPYGLMHPATETLISRPGETTHEFVGGQDAGEQPEECIVLGCGREYQDPVHSE